MEEIIGVVIFAIVVGLMTTAWEYIKGRNKKNDNKKIGQDTRSLFLDTLTKIGCQYQLGEDDDTRIFFDYQGESFLPT